MAPQRRSRLQKGVKSVGIHTVRGMHKQGALCRSLAASLQQTTRHQYPKEGVSTFEVEAVAGQLEGVERPHRTLSVHPVSCCLQFQTGIRYSYGGIVDAHEPLLIRSQR